MLKKTAAPKLLSTFTFVYFCLLVYASLMPYDFTTDIPYHKILIQALNHWPINPQGRISGSDVVSNLILYIPLGYLIASRNSFTAAAWLKPCVIAILFCMGTSLMVELAQAATLSRTASITDWILNSISGAIGSFSGAKYGKHLWTKYSFWISQRWQQQPLDILTLALFALLIADSLAPFLPTLLLSQVWRSVKASHFNLIEGYLQHPWHWWFFTRSLIYMILTILIANWYHPEKRRLNWLNASLICIFLAITLEIGKLFIISRTMNLANITTSFSGILLAVIILNMRTVKLNKKRKLELGVLIIIVYVLYLAWTPFNFHWDIDQFRQKIPSTIQLLPFYHYAMGATLEHVRLFIQSIFLQGALIYFLRLRYEYFDNYRFKVPLAILIVGILGVLQEGGQLFLSTRTPSMTDIYCFMMGGGIGAMLPLFGKNISLQQTVPDRFSHDDIKGR